MTKPKRKHPFRLFGEFCGHIARAVKADPASNKQERRKTIEEEQRGNITLRRTTIEEIEFHDARQ
jgi:hypothetical protein